MAEGNNTGSDVSTSHTFEPMVIEGSPSVFQDDMCVYVEDLTINPKESDRAPKEVEVTFFAEIATGWNNPMGHIWVQFNGNRSYGFQPVGDVGALLTLSTVDERPGREAEADVSYTFSVSEESANRGLEVIDVYRQKLYIFPLHNCKDMIHDVAEAIGLKTPSTFMKSPAEFLADLVEANPASRGIVKALSSRSQLLSK